MQYVRHKNQKYIAGIALVITVAMAYVWGYNHFKKPVFPDLNRYGIPVAHNQSVAETDSVQGRLTVRQLLNRKGISIERAEAYETLLAERNIRTVVRPGSRIEWISPTENTDAEPAYLVFEPNYRRKAILNLQDTSVSMMQKTPTWHYEMAGGVIDHSLYATVEEQNLSLNIVEDLSAIFAWQIDFYKLNRGDRFKVIYRRKYYDGLLTNEGELVAAVFVHNNRPYYAFRFLQGNSWEYFDNKGKPLKKAFLRAPLEYKQISSYYSEERFHPILKRVVPHLGTDYAAPEGTPIRAVGKGEVVMSGYSPKSGLNVKIKHNGTYSTGYLHMSRIGAGIEPGTRVVQGEVIGYVGRTGLATGPHLCFRFWKGGRQVDPYDENFASKPGISNNRRDLYEYYTGRLKTALDTMAYPEERRALAGLQQKN